MAVTILRSANGAIPSAPARSRVRHGRSPSIAARPLRTRLALADSSGTPRAPAAPRTSAPACSSPGGDRRRSAVASEGVGSSRHAIGWSPSQPSLPPTPTLRRVRGAEPASAPMRLDRRPTHVSPSRSLARLVPALSQVTPCPRPRPSLSCSLSRWPRPPSSSARTTRRRPRPSNNPSNNPNSDRFLYRQNVHNVLLSSK